MGAIQTGAVRRVASARLRTRWGLFNALAFERDFSNGGRRLETALALVSGDLDSDEGAPLLRIHAQCLTGETLRSLRCDYADQLDLAMREIAHEGRGLVIYEHQGARGIGLIATLLIQGIGIALDVSGKRMLVPEGD